MDETGTGAFPFNLLDFLVLSGTTSVTIASTGAINGTNFLTQLAEKDNVLTTVTINDSEVLDLGSFITGNANRGDAIVTDVAAPAGSTIHSSLTLIDASTTPAAGCVSIFAGATNTSGAGSFDNGASLNANVTITYSRPVSGTNGNEPTPAPVGTARNLFMTVSRELFRGFCHEALSAAIWALECRSSTKPYLW